MHADAGSVEAMAAVFELGMGQTVSGHGAASGSSVQSCPNRVPMRPASDPTSSKRTSGPDGCRHGSDRRGGPSRVAQFGAGRGDARHALADFDLAHPRGWPCSSSRGIAALVRGCARRLSERFCGICVDFSEIFSKCGKFATQDLQFRDAICVLGFWDDGMSNLILWLENQGVDRIVVNRSTILNCVFVMAFLEGEHIYFA